MTSCDRHTLLFMASAQGARLVNLTIRQRRALRTILRERDELLEACQAALAGTPATAESLLRGAINRAAGD